ncbi:hypothetical protein [Dietzia timorensis]|uniref:Uncharacterized protein n=1 Tax=Dietzia timorensis TaxID=499555 RepID=A0A173LL78_9ACTN|nr:hypothetical protein [Dietzia timorensis]ANI91360.1 Hypothetical protein BJL86_0557 [Dietzia timorensis]
MPESKRSEEKILRAMVELLAAPSEKTDKKPTKTDLATQANISRATLYRHRDLLDTWDRCVDRRGCGQDRARVKELEELLEKERESRELAEQLSEGLANAYVELFEQTKPTALSIERSRRSDGIGK